MDTPQCQQDLHHQGPSTCGYHALPTHTWGSSGSWGGRGADAHIDTHALEVLLKFVGSPSRGTDGGGQGGHALALGELQELRHLRGWEADEVEGSYPVTNTHILHLYNEDGEEEIHQ